MPEKDALTRLDNSSDSCWAGLLNWPEFRESPVLIQTAVADVQDFFEDGERNPMSAASAGRMLNGFFCKKTTGILGTLTKPPVFTEASF